MNHVANAIPRVDQLSATRLEAAHPQVELAEQTAHLVCALHGHCFEHGRELGLQRFVLVLLDLDERAECGDLLGELIDALAAEKRLKHMHKHTTFESR